MRKTADVIPLPKKKPVELLEKDMRPISLAPAVPKVAKGFILDDCVKPLVREGARWQAVTTINTLYWYVCFGIGPFGQTATDQLLGLCYLTIVGRLTLLTVLSSLNYIPRVVCQLGFRLPIWSIAGNQISRGLFFWVGSVPSGVTKGTKLGP